VEVLQPEDLKAIAQALHPGLPAKLINKMINLLSAMQLASSSSSMMEAQAAGSGQTRPFAAAGGPWEFNLRDLLRWCELLCLFAAQQQQQQQQHQTAAAAATAAAAPPAQHNDASPMDVDVAHHHPQQQQQQQQQYQLMLGPPCGCSHELLDYAAEHFAGILFTQRLRTAADRQQLLTLFAQVWGRPLKAVSSLGVVEQQVAAAAAAAAAAAGSLHGIQHGPSDDSSSSSNTPGLVINPWQLQVGIAAIPRAADVAAAAAAEGCSTPSAAPGLPSVGQQQQASSSSSMPSSSGLQQRDELLLPSWQAPLLESVVAAASAGWMVLLVGPGGSGKTSLARLVAELVGVELQELALTQGTDTGDLLGSFEQVRERWGGWGSWHSRCGCVTLYIFTYIYIYTLTQTFTHTDTPICICHFGMVHGVGTVASTSSSNRLHKGRSHWGKPLFNPRNPGFDIICNHLCSSKPRQLPAA
jgi:midasin